MRVVATDLAEPVVGALVFRVGTADEPFPQRGITHLVEHLALFSVATNPRLEFNGHVEFDRTMLWARGSRQDVLAFLSQVADGIRGLPAERLPDEMRVLQTEAAGRRGSLLEHLLRLRFGGSGYGMADYVEKGMGWLVGQAVQKWADQWFCAENCVCMLTCPPDGLSLDLPSGVRAPDPPIDPLPGVQFPAQLRYGSGTVAATFVAPRSWEAVAATSLLAKSLHEALRIRDAISYEAVPMYTRLGADMAHLTVAADCLDEHAVKVRQRAWETIQAFASAGPEPDRLAEWQDGWERNRPEPEQLARSELDRIARELLWGCEPESIDELEEERQRLTPDAIAAAFAAAAPTMLLAVPSETPGELEQVPQFDPVPHRKPDGRVFKFESGSLNPKYWRRRVIVSGDAVCLVKRDGEPITITAAACIGAEYVDGTLRLYGRDGSWMGFKPQALRRPEAALEAIEKVIPPSKFLGGGGPRSISAEWSGQPARWTVRWRRLAYRLVVFGILATSLATHSHASRAIWIVVASVFFVSAVLVLIVQHRQSS